MDRLSYDRGSRRKLTSLAYFTTVVCNEVWFAVGFLTGYISISPLLSE